MLYTIRRATTTVSLQTTASILCPLKHLSTLSLLSPPQPNPKFKPLTKPQLKTLILNHYKHGKFLNLIQNVVASPSVLLTASLNLNTAHHNHDLDSVSTHFFSIEEMADQLYQNRFDLESCCVRVPAFRGESIVLPNLKLKVVIEAIRIVLEVVYDDRFATFSYGGRVGMGRHTAIRYLKNSVENPSWWFRVSFDREKFDSKNVEKLCLIIGDKIEDKLLIDMIKKLFEFEVICIELGGYCLGRGFPQECGLNSILINVYLNGLDLEIQELRLKTNKENPKLKSDDLLSAENSVFYKPLKIYAVRYLDEILVITSGTKLMTMDLKNRVVKFLENNLELTLDKVNTAIHSAVSEKIEFLGMELQAVTPSVLHPPLSEKAIRAKKKYQRQKEVKALELRNARETNRKKLGLKIWNHVFKKLKLSNGFKFEFQIKNEVNEIFKTWADEVVKEFLDSLEEKSKWHRKLTAGDFLDLKRIRDQLPQDLVDSYDNFQEQVNKYLKPVKARKLLEEEEREKNEEEERRYCERTVKDLTTLCIKVNAPAEKVKQSVKMVGFTNNMGRPRPITLLMALEDSHIIKWYAGVGKRFLEFFSCCHNFKFVKTVVSYHLRFSCILTLAEKHESTKREAIKHYTKDLKIFDVTNGSEEVNFPSEKSVKMMGEGNFVDPKPVDSALTLALVRLAYDEPPYRCVAHFCTRNDTTVYRVHLLQMHMNVNPKDDKKWVCGMGFIHEGLSRKCLPLCDDHVSELYLGKLTLEDLDCTSFVDVD